MKNERKLEYLVFIRALSAILVLLHHLWIMYWYNNPSVVQSQAYLNIEDDYYGLAYINIFPLLSRLHLDFGKLGVSMFFLLTGFLAASSINRQPPKKFLINKIFRIYPIYVIGFFITFLSIFLYTKIFGYGFNYTILDLIKMVSLSGEGIIIDGSWTLVQMIRFHVIIFVIACLKNIIIQDGLVVLQ